MFSLSDATSANSVCLPIIIKGSDGRWQQLNITTNAMMKNYRKSTTTFCKKILLVLFHKKIIKENWLKMISIHSSVSVWFEVRSFLRNIYDHFWQLWPGFVKGAEIPLVTIFGLRISGSSRVNSATKFSWLLSPWFLALFTVWSMGGVAFYWDLLRDVTNLESDLSQIIYRKYL